MKVLHAICFSGSLLHAFIKNKEAKDLLLYIDTLELKKKSWHKMSTSDGSHIY